MPETNKDILDMPLPVSMLSERSRKISCWAFAMLIGIGPLRLPLILWVGCKDRQASGVYTLSGDFYPQKVLARYPSGLKPIKLIQYQGFFIGENGVAFRKAFATYMPLLLLKGRRKGVIAFNASPATEAAAAG